MDKSVENIFGEFEKRAQKESERMRDMDMSTKQQHVDEFLLSVGPATGQLISALIVADNMLYPESSRKHAEAYRKHIRTKPHIESLLLQVGSGLELTSYK